MIVDDIIQKRIAPFLPETTGIVSDSSDLQEVTIRLEKETFQRLETKAKENDTTTEALIRKILIGEVIDVPDITKFGSVYLDKHGELCLHGFSLDYKDLDIRRDIGGVYALIAYLKNELDKHLLKYPDVDTVEVLQDGAILNSNENMLYRASKQHDINS